MNNIESDFKILDELFDKELLLNSVYKETKEKIIEFGVKQILEDLGFKVSYSNEIVDYNPDGQFDIFEFVDFKAIKDSLIHEILQDVNTNYVLKQIKNSNTLKELKGAVILSIIENTKITLRQQVQSELYTQYYEHMKKELINDLMKSDEFKNLKLESI